jgi:hypothetical protein
MLFVEAATGVARSSDEAVNFKYYCPRANSTYIGSQGKVQIVSGPYLPFPRTQAGVGGQDEPTRRSAKTRDCSTADFVCLFVEPGLGLAGLYLFLPRVIEPGRTYKFNNMDAITYYATSEGPPPAQAQVVLWQRVDGRETPIALTVDQARGVIYIDGLELWNSTALWPSRAQTCVLVSGRGLFKGVRLALPAKQPQPRPD